MGDKEIYDAYTALLSTSARDSVVKEDEFADFEEKANKVVTRLEEKREHLNLYEQGDAGELEKLNLRILELQDSYLGKQDFIEENVESIGSLEKDLSDLGATLKKSQNRWNEEENRYISQSIGAGVIPSFIKSLFNYYPPDHPLYSPGVESIEGLESEKKPSKFRSFMNETRLGIETKSKEKNYLSIDNMFKNRDLLNTGKSIKQLRDEYYRASFKMPEGLLEEFNPNSPKPKKVEEKTIETSKGRIPHTGR
tara:strand:- start:211 stop:966 length:756 start_codon:yes stop_codon:yes gene_type:complete